MSSFWIGGQDRMPHLEILVWKCSIVYIGVVHFPFTFVGGDVLCRFLFWVFIQKQQKDSIQYNRIAVFNRMPQNIWWKINWSIIKNVIYKYPPIFLTLPAFYQLVCYTVWIEACARQFSPIKQRRLFALASFSILLLWHRRRIKTEEKERVVAVFWGCFLGVHTWMPR